MFLLFRIKSNVIHRRNTVICLRSICEDRTERRSVCHDTWISSTVGGKNVVILSVSIFSSYLYNSKTYNPKLRRAKKIIFHNYENETKNTKKERKTPNIMA